jgi:NAD(P)H-hydrate epimerase
MLDLFSTEQMRDAEERAEIEFGIPLAELMDNAGRRLAECAASMLGDKKRVGVMCGKGNNGGDGYVCAALLLSQGFNVTVYGISVESLTPCSLAENAATAYESSGGTIKPLTENFSASELDFDLIIDALFGTGLSRQLSDLYIQIINEVNKSGIPVLSCDLPSGINADTGEIMGAAVKAKRTLMLGLAKLACRIYPGRECFGELLIADIGLPYELTSRYTAISL